MSFPHSIRVRAMIAAARHCCLCRRYKGVKLEVHHITPESKGGANTLENAVVLCFDCHADAGAYNPDHPRGTRITPQELRQARREWYEIVRTGAIEPPKAEIAPFHCRYIIGKDFSLLSEIIASDLKHFPLANRLLVRTPSLEFLARVVGSHPHDYRSDHVYGDTYETADQYLAAHADTEIRPTHHEGGFEYFTFERTVSREELIERVAPEDGVTRLLLEQGIPHQQIARGLAYEEACAGGFPEIYRTRPLWGVFLAITNFGSEPAHLVSLEGETYGRGPRDFIPFHSSIEKSLATIPLPSAAIPPDHTVVVPVSVVLGPFDHFSLKEGFSRSTELERARSQTFSHVVAGEERTWASFTWGPAFFPRRIRFQIGGFEENQSVHELNVSNVYEIDRRWAMGSCPHAFIVHASGAIRYLGEVLAQGCNRLVTDTLSIPADATAVVIAELEEEVTHLQIVRSGSETLITDHVLHQGEFVSFKAGAGEVTVEGFYVPKHPAGQQQPIRRNALVGNFRAVFNHMSHRPAIPPPERQGTRRNSRKHV